MFDIEAFCQLADKMEAELIKESLRVYGVGLTDILMDHIITSEISFSDFDEAFRGKEVDHLQKYLLTMDQIWLLINYCKLVLNSFCGVLICLFKVNIPNMTLQDEDAF